MMMPLTVDPLLGSAIDAMALPGIAIGHRLILPGDEGALLASEADAFASSVVQVRRSSGAARIVARELLARLGIAPGALPKARSGAPIWPEGIVGSLAHDPLVAIAAIARSTDFLAVGIDIEPAELLPAELLDLVATPQEQRKITDDPFRGRLLFAAKEAVYKAVYPIDQTFLDHHDVEVDFADCKAVVRQGRVVQLRICVSTHIVVLAYLSGSTDAEPPPID